MSVVIKDRVKETTTTTGTGTITLAGAVSGFQAFSVIGDGNTTKYCILDANGTGWETGIGTYTAAGTTLARTTVLASSNSGSAITLSSGTHTVFCDWTGTDGQSAHDSNKTYISGLLITKASATQISVSAGAAWVPAAGKVVTYAGGTITPTLTNSTATTTKIYSVFLNADGTIEVDQEAPPTSAYAGTARTRGIGNLGRFIGCFYSLGVSAAVVEQLVTETGSNYCLVKYDTASFAAPFLLVNNAIQATMVALDMSAIVPPTVSPEVMIWTLFTQGTGYHTIDISLDGTNDAVFVRLYAGDAANNPGGSLWCPTNPATPSFYYDIPSPGGYIQLTGYKFQR